MTAEHIERMRLRHRPDDLFDLVSDVRAIPDFIP
jgi:coenzyme Q-binding protein COQ10